MWTPELQFEAVDFKWKKLNGLNQVRFTYFWKFTLMVKTYKPEVDSYIEKKSVKILTLRYEYRKSIDIIFIRDLYQNPIPVKYDDWSQL